MTGGHGRYGRRSAVFVMYKPCRLFDDSDLGPIDVEYFEALVDEHPTFVVEATSFASWSQVLRNVDARSGERPLQCVPSCRKAWVIAEEELSGASVSFASKNLEAGKSSQGGR